jgi:hypothetical protein
MRLPVTLVAMSMAGLIGCATPIGVSKYGPEAAFKQVNSTILNSRNVSVASWEVLHRFDLVERFDKTPGEVLAQLKERACQDTRRDLLFALAELSYAVAARTDDRAYYLQSSVYAYLYLFAPSTDARSEPPDPYDRRFRVAIDLYNRALAQALANKDRSEILVSSRVLQLPRGRVEVKTSRYGFLTDKARFPSFLSADNFKVRGIERYRDPGLGIPLIAIPVEPPMKGVMELTEGRLPPRLKIPATALLRIKGDACDAARGELTASLELYSVFDSKEVKINNHPVPLEADLSTPLAYTLEQSRAWEFETAGFFGREVVNKATVMLAQPYQPGKIPVVFIHGTASSPARWAAMLNGLQSDPLIRQRFQFWMFIYPSGNPIAYSASLLRESLTRVVKALDPQGKDQALRQMVLIGHSQGGLLAKMMVTDSGDRFWKNFSDKSIDEIDLNNKDRALLKKVLFFKHVPFVHQVIFIATPQHGSFVSASWIGRFFSGLVTLPVNLVKAPGELINAMGSNMPAQYRGKIPTSVDNMSPDHPFIRTLAALPIAPGVHYHSIIAVKKGYADIKEGNDGVVTYSSAHLEGADSELVVRSSHSVQGNPLAIEEVRRILMEQIGQTAPPVVITPEGASEEAPAKQME